MMRVREGALMLGKWIGTAALAIVALGGTGGLMALSFWAGPDMSADPFTKKVWQGIFTITDIAEVGFLLMMLHAYRDCAWAKMWVCAILWIGLSGITVYSSQAWLAKELNREWQPYVVAEQVRDTAKQHLDEVNKATLSTDWQKARAAKKEKPAAVAAFLEAASKVPVMLQNNVKGNEWMLTLVVLLIAHAAWFVIGGHDRRTASQDMAAWGRRHGRNRSPDRPDKPSDRQDRPSDRPKEDDGNSKVINFPQRTGKPSKADVLKLVSDGWLHRDIAERYGIHVRTIGRYVAEDRRRQAASAEMVAA
jgi:hypothetical protein